MGSGSQRGLFPPERSIKSTLGRRVWAKAQRQEEDSRCIRKEICVVGKESGGV